MTIQPTANASEREMRLAALVRLEQRARACADEAALAFLMVNDTHAISSYRQAVLWMADSPGSNGDGRILALSGLAVPDRHAPFNTWLCARIARHAAKVDAHSPGAFDAPETTPLHITEQPGDAAMWSEHLPAHGWWLPLAIDASAVDATVPRTPVPAGLLLLRDAPWPAHDTKLLALATDAYTHAWRALRQTPGMGLRRRWRERFQRRRRWILPVGIAVVLGLLALPVRQSVLAPAEVVARAPSTVRAPLQGVVDRIEVQPNQAVQTGQLLATLDAREFEGKLESARQALAVAEAELRQGQQQALFDERSKTTLALLQGRRDQASADVDYLATALARTQVRAERSGIALFDDPADWIGKPVALGERIMLVAEPLDAELELHLPVADAIALPNDARVLLFLNTAPASPIEATVQRVGYRAAPVADGSLAYRVRARFNAVPTDGSPLRVGLKGTAKLYGGRTVLAVYLLRRPLAALRVWLGL